MLKTVLETHNAGTLADIELAAAYLKNEALKVRRVSGRYILQVIDWRGIVATLDHGNATEAMDALRRAIPMLGSLHLLREYGLAFPDSLNN